MKIVCVDENKILLAGTLDLVREMFPDAEIVGFDNPDDAVVFAKMKGCDILLTEIELHGRPSGIDGARRIQKMNQKVNIIFNTVCSPNEYAKEIIQIRPSAYLTKVVEREELESALANLLYPA